MELVRGVPIVEYCDQYKLDVKSRLLLFIDVCRAVEHAHQKGIIHRDLKPTNILVSRNDAASVPKVIDFGIAKATGGEIAGQTAVTGFKQLLGTPLYMSPEQAEMSNLDIDTRSDVYSLGAVLYELLTGHTPFDKRTMDAADFDELRRLIREFDPPRPSNRLSTLGAEKQSTVSALRGVDVRALSRRLRGELDWIVMKSLEKDRARRYASAKDLARDVERHLHDQPVEACPPSAIYKLKKFARRNKTPLAAGAAIAGVLVAGIVGTTWQMLRAMGAERVAETATKEVRSEAMRARSEAARANDQRRRAEDERQRAIDSLKLARRVVDSLYLQVGTQWIADETAPSKFQQGILIAAVRFYEDLAETQVGNLSVVDQSQFVTRRIAASPSFFGAGARTASRGAMPEAPMPPIADGRLHSRKSMRQATDG
jgi:hypothetical protein